jgi:hypothetical protein
VTEQGIQINFNDELEKQLSPIPAKSDFGPNMNPPSHPFKNDDGPRV